MLLWHNTKLKTIGAIMSTLMYTRLLQMLQCCSVCSIECCVFSVYISYIPQYLHIYRFTHCWLADSVLPGQTVGRMQPRKQTITRLRTPDSSSLPFIFWTDFTKPVPAENATYCATYQIASQIELSCLTPLKISS